MINAPLPLPESIKGALRQEPMSREELAVLLDTSRRQIADQIEILEARGKIRRLGDTKYWVNVQAPKGKSPGRIFPDTTSMLYRAVEMVG